MDLHLPHLDEEILDILLLMFAVLCLYQTYKFLRTCAKGFAPAIQIAKHSIPSMYYTYG